ncbi:MAG: polysaccharide biosynthesis C-terminal domain-containing protein [bacterium]|nr:polysaccharide biosynthesis C-terminal domain-containing protein [bacterium]
MTDKPTINSASTRSIAAIVGVAGVVFVSKLLGLGREIVVADRFGTSAEYDLYLIAIMLPALAYGIINFASYFLLVPYLTRFLEKRPADGGWRSIWGLFNRSILFSLAIAFLIMLGAPFLMRIWAGDYGGVEFKLIVFYCRIIALMVVLGTSEAYLRALLNVRHVFTWPAGGYIVENILFITAVVLFHNLLGVGAIIIGLLGGMIGQNIFLAARLIPSGGIAKYRLSLKTEHMDGMVSTILLLLGIELVNRSYFLFDRFVATDFGVGIISSLNYSQVLVQLPDAVVGFAIASVVFPKFAGADLSKQDNAFGKLYRNAIVGGMLLTIPLAAFFLVNATDLVQVVFFRGRFDASSVEMTATLLRPYTPTIVALFVISTSLRAAYGQGWTKQVLYLALIALAVKATATLVLPGFIGYPGITVATSISFTLMAVGLLLLCLTKIRANADISLLPGILRLILAGAISGLAGYLFASPIDSLLPGNSFGEAVGRLAISGLTILAAFLAAALLFGFRPYFALLFRRKYVS